MKGCMSHNRKLAQLVVILACNAIVANWSESDLKTCCLCKLACLLSGNLMAMFSFTSRPLCLTLSKIDRHSKQLSAANLKIQSTICIVFKLEHQKAVKINPVNLLIPVHVINLFALQLFLAPTFRRASDLVA